MAITALASSVITPEQVQAYHEDGYVVLRQLVSPELLAELKREGFAALDRANNQGLDPNAHWQGTFDGRKEGKPLVVNAIHDMQFQSALYGKLLYHEGIGEVAEALIGPNVQLHHTKFFYKPPRTGGVFPLHQDYPYFPHARHSMMAMIIHFDDATEENGCVRVVPGSHRSGPLPTAEGQMYLPTEEYPISLAKPVPAHAGDVLAFNYLTIHGSGPNTSDRERTTVLLQLRDPEDEPTVLRHRSRGQGMMLRGVNPRHILPAWKDPS